MTVKRLAVFVEGQTEQIFLKSLIAEIFGQNSIQFDVVAYRKIRHIISLKQKKPAKTKKYEVLIVDCQNDENVKSTILENRPSLIDKNYSLIIGLRDLHPKPPSYLKTLKKGLKYGLPTAGCPTQILLSVQEIEAWFLQEDLHYAKIHSRLNISDFKKRFKFDPTIDSAEDILKPSELLNKIYTSVGKKYSKRRTVVEKTVKKLDYENLYFNSRSRLPHFNELVTLIESFI